MSKQPTFEECKEAFEKARNIYLYAASWIDPNSVEELQKKAREAGIKAIQKLYSDSKNISIEQQAISNISNKEKCECRNCLDDFEKLNPPGPGLSHWTTRMVVCSICGNKRCPHANNHNNPCTNSNEPGQPGSSYSMSEIKNKTTQPSDAPEPARARRLVGWHPPAEPGMTCMPKYEDVLPASAQGEVCEKCGGAGWVWGHELPTPEETPTDTRYSCPVCQVLLIYGTPPSIEKNGEAHHQSHVAPPNSATASSPASPASEVKACPAQSGHRDSFGQVTCGHSAPAPSPASGESAIQEMIDTYGSCVGGEALKQRSRAELASLRAELNDAQVQEYMSRCRGDVLAETNESLRELLVDVFDLWDDDVIEHSTPDNYARAQTVFDRILAVLPPEKQAAILGRRTP